MYEKNNIYWFLHFIELKKKFSHLSSNLKKIEIIFYYLLTEIFLG